MLIFIAYPNQNMKNIGGAEVIYDISFVSIFMIYEISISS